jgi:hypothetical protein
MVGAEAFNGLSEVGINTAVSEAWDHIRFDLLKGRGGVHIFTGCALGPQHSDTSNSVRWFSSLVLIQCNFRWSTCLYIQFLSQSTIQCLLQVTAKEWQAASTYVDYTCFIVEPNTIKPRPLTLS